VVAVNILGACPRIEYLLRKAHFGQLFRTFSLNSTTTVKHILVLNPCGAYAKECSQRSFRLKCSKNLTQNGPPSQRSLFSDRLLACLATGLVIATISACSTNNIQQSSATPAQFSSHPDSAVKGTELIWGGEIVSVRNEVDRTLLEILAYPLNSSGGIVAGYSSTGRFLADRQGYLEPREYVAGRRVTVKGPFLGFKDGQVDDAFYRYPVLEARELILLPEPSIEQYRQPRVNVGVGVGSHGRSGVSIGVGF